MTEKDTVITQDIKILQQAVKEAIKHGPDGVNIINIGQIQVTPTLEKIIQPIDTEKAPQQRLNRKINPRLPESFQDADKLMESLLDILPEPKYDNLIFLALKMACKNSPTKAAAASFLGIPQTTLYHWTARLGLSTAGDK